MILFTEPHSELNAGLVVVCASRHQPILDLTKLDIPVIKDAEAWSRLQTYGTSALRGYRHLMKGYLATCLDPEGMPSEVASTWIQTGLALTPFAFAETRFSVDWALAWALIGEWLSCGTFVSANAASIMVVLHDSDRETVPWDCTKPDGLFCRCSACEAFAS